MDRRNFLSVVALTPLSSSVRAADPGLREQAAAGLKKAVTFFRSTAVQGGYVWRVSEDLAKREGERPVTATQVWVQPPGTPAVGLALLNAYRATGDAFYRDAAVETAHALVRGQLRSGGWDYKIEFEPKLRSGWAYRTESTVGKMNVTTLDDNTTQASLRCLMQTDAMLDRKDPAIHEAAIYALDSLLQAQFPNGAWPQRFDASPDAAKHPVQKASFPETWSREFPKVNYYAHYTFNDGSHSDVIDVMLEAERLYGSGKYKAAAVKGGEFILLAQLPDPQPGWAQQYDAEMHPAWARKFEPPSITGGEAQGAMKTLMRLYRETGDAKFLETIPKALEYYRKLLLADGRLARFYELKTNKPLYFTKDYKLTYDDSDVPTHYGFKVPSTLDALEKELESVKPRKPVVEKPRGKASPKQEADVRAVLKALDEKGRWVEDGKLRNAVEESVKRVIDTRTFLKNVQVLASYLASKP